MPDPVLVEAEQGETPCLRIGRRIILSRRHVKQWVDQTMEVRWKNGETYKEEGQLVSGRGQAETAAFGVIFGLWYNNSTCCKEIFKILIFYSTE